MHNLRIFKSKEFGQVRTVTIDNEPWFVGKDVATALGYKNTKDALATHVEDCDKIVGSQNATPSIKDSMGRKQYPTWINESGLYALIFGSKLESAKRFKHWVTSDVLPAIRKTGGYQMWMRDNGYLMKSGNNYNMPMQRYVEQGLFEIKERSITNPDGSVKLTRTTKVTGKGQQYFINKFLKKTS